MANRIWTAVIPFAALLLLNTTAHAATAVCPCTIWPSDTVPSVIDQGADSPVELGVTFHADSNGYVTGIRFYKSSANTGTHVGNLWSNTGRLLATATFTGESASGWQQVNFSTPVAITANTTYVASYHTNAGHYSIDETYFSTSGVDKPPLHAMANGSGSLNGPYAYGSGSSFPSTTYRSTNYWVDVVFNTAVNTTPAPPTIATQPSGQTVAAGQTATFSVAATGTAPLNYQWRKNGVNLSGATSSSYTTPATTTADSGAQFSVVVSNSAGSATSSSATLSVSAAAVAPSITTQPSSQTVAAGQTATFSVAATGTAPLTYQWRKNGVNLSGATSSSYTTPATTTADSGSQFSAVVSNSAGSTTSSSATLSVNASSVCPCTVWTSTAVPAVADGGPDSPVELGVTFRSDSSGYITGVRFYKSTGNTGTHVGNLWSSTGTLLATATFSGESASGWQQVNFSNRIAITANTAYVASYHSTVGHYSADQNYFATSGIDTPPLHAMANGGGGLNGPYAYGSGSSFPNTNYKSSNYWVDVVFNTSVNTTLVAPTITTQPAGNTVIVGQTATFSVAATGTAPLAYQWRKNDANISGATSSSYTTPATTTTDSGAQFSVVVSNSAGSATSNNAALTVTAATRMLSANPTSLSFGNVSISLSSVLTSTLTNAGNSNVTISNVTISGAGLTVSGLSTGQIVAPGQSVILSATFLPAVTGSVTGSVVVTSDAGNSPTTISLSGTGVQLVTHFATLSWTASSSSVAGYNVYSGTVSGGPYAKITASPVATVSYKDSSVQSGKTYYYVVTAINPSSVESAYSNQVFAAIP